MKYLLKENHTGRGPFKVIAEFMNEIARIINGSKVMTGGYMRVTPRGLKFYLDGGEFAGDCYAPNGVKTGGLTDGTKPWIDFDESDWSFTEIVGPVGTPWAAGHQYRLKSDLRGAWYASLNG